MLLCLVRKKEKDPIVKDFSSLYRQEQTHTSGALFRDIRCSKGQIGGVIHCIAVAESPLPWETHDMG
jgi:hypothetical protein